MIENAEHFIYIENQYFISNENALTETLFQRVCKAIREDAIFRVVVVLPITPCGDWKLPAIKFVMKWQYDTISRGGNSILERIKKKFPSVNVNDYISFCCLRKVDELNGIMVTDQVYVHSKLMIVDDRRVIIGSANWNDRSMLGDRDSEIAVLVEDNRFVESKMNGQFFLASKFAHSLRKNLFLEHLGLPRSKRHEVQDPICSAVYNDMIRDYASSNQHIFTSMFPLVPSDNFTSTTVC